MMKYTTEKLISPLKYFGAKFYMARRIIEKMQFRDIFIEGFSCTNVISLNIDEKFHSHISIEKNPHIVNFWKQLQVDNYNGGRLYKFLCNTEYSEENFERAKKYLSDNDKLIIEPFFDAAMFLICNRMSRSADMKTFGWSDRLRRGMPEYISAYKTAISSLPKISHLIDHIHFLCGDYTTIISNLGWNKYKDCVSYIDPPYMHSTRSLSRPYGKYEMGEVEHVQLLDFVLAGHNLTYISGYNSPLYEAKLRGYKRYDWNIKNSASQSKVKPINIESLWEIIRK